MTPNQLCDVATALQALMHDVSTPEKQQRFSRLASCVQAAGAEGQFRLSAALLEYEFTDVSSALYGLKFHIGPIAGVRAPFGEPELVTLSGFDSFYRQHRQGDDCYRSVELPTMALQLNGAGVITQHPALFEEMHVRLMVGLGNAATAETVNEVVDALERIGQDVGPTNADWASTVISLPHEVCCALLDRFASQVAGVTGAELRTPEQLLYACTARQMGEGRALEAVFTRFPAAGFGQAVLHKVVGDLASSNKLEGVKAILNAMSWDLDAITTALEMTKPTNTSLKEWLAVLQAARMAQDALEAPTQALSPL